MKFLTFPQVFALAFLVALPACTPDPKDTGADDTGIDDTDPADTDTDTDDPVLEVCDNGTDDDDDGAIDCDDTDCAKDPACVELDVEDCTDGIDNDADATIDCDDSDCAKDDACTAPVTEIDCENGLDDDGDSLIDCDDDDCAGDLACESPATEIECVDGLDNDGDKLVDCDDIDCAADPACIPEPVETLCADGIDDDSDGLTDCDDSDCDFDLACAATIVETACEDGIDDDEDGLTDCEDDDCAEELACAPRETCGETDLGSSVGLELASGTTIGAIDDFTASCRTSAAEDVSYTWTAPDDGTYTFSTAGSSYDTIITLWGDECSLEEACNDDSVGTTSATSYDMLAGDTVVIVVDGYSTRSGDYVLSVYPTYEDNCTDGLDSDYDSDTDCDDSDCAEDAACLRETVCDDSIDEDLDGLTDCDDDDCAADRACSASGTCADVDLGSVLGSSVATGSSTGAGNDYTGTCGGGSAEDVSYTWTAPGTGTFEFTTLGSSFDTVLMMWSDDCAEQYECNDDYAGIGTRSGFERDLIEGEEVVIVVDAWSTGSGDYVLNVAATTEYDCTDGGDDDADGVTDCEDTDCSSTLYCETPCADDDLGSAFGDSVASGNTTGGGDDYMSGCAFYETEDVSWRWTAPADGVYTIDTVGSSYDTMLSVETGECAGSEIACNDDTVGTTSEVSVALLDGEEVVIHVEGWSTTGDYILNVWSGAEVVCNDGIDEDLDGATDCDDEDCSSDRECSGAEIECDNAVDDDIDGSQDCLDEDCAVDEVCDTTIADADLGSTTGSPIATGTTVGMGNDWTPSCGYSPSAPEYTYAWVAPSTRTWSFDTTGSSYDTILGAYAWDGTSLGCDDDGADTPRDSLLSLALEAGELVIISVDGYSASSGAYSLSIY